MTGAAQRPLLVDREGAVLWLTLNRPEKRNALDVDLIGALKREVTAASADADLRVVAIRGAGKDFCAGADLASIRRVAQAPVMENLADADDLAELYLGLRRCRKPVIAVVHGRALAGGCGLATACDLVISSESARFGYPEVQRGFVPAMVMAILRRSVPEKVAFEMVALGEQLAARDALNHGLINRVVPDDQLEPESRKLTEQLAGRSASAVQLCKRLLHHQDGMPFESALRAGADLNVIARLTEDSRAGIRDFLEGRRA